MDQRMEHLTRQADELAATRGPGAAFFAFFALVAGEGVANRGLAEALAGDVRPDVGYQDVKALLAGCLARDAADAATLEPVIMVICQGLQPQAREASGGTGSGVLGGQPA
jgi:hypothetical protein